MEMWSFPTYFWQKRDVSRRPKLGAVKVLMTWPTSAPTGLSSTPGTSGDFGCTRTTKQMVHLRAGPHQGEENQQPTSSSENLSSKSPAFRQAAKITQGG